MRLLALLLLIGLSLPSRGATAQAPDEGWNSPRAVELIRRAQQRRTQSFTDTGLVNYRADARIYVYFYLDREDTGERNLVKTDQLALEVLWQAPDRVKQRIVGWRDQKSLPTNIHYHLDHLTVVQENFGNEIRIGDGDEVRGVPHPAIVGSEAFYEFRLADSLTLRLPGAEEAVRVYELEVRPRDPSQPALIGSVFVDRREGDIVRMDFTFTAASYVDRYLDYINISLDNGLWRGRFWLPNEQRVEIRRRIPQLDLPAGSVIRANMRIGGYEFNQPLSPLTFLGPTVVAAPAAEREAFPFEQDLFAEVREEGLGPQMELEEIRRRAVELAREQALRRAAGVRLWAPRLSDVVRYDRAEGLALGMGVALTPRTGVRLGARAGYASGAEHPLASLELDAGTGATRAHASVYLNRPRDVGVGPVASGLVNTLTSLFAAEDYTDLYYTSGVELGVTHILQPGWTLSAGARLERHASAERTADYSVFGGDFRPVARIDDADLFAGAEVTLRRAAPSGAASWWEGALTAEVGAMDVERTCIPEDQECTGRAGPPFLKPRAELSLGRRWTPGRSELRVDAAGGAALGGLPRQEVYLLGGRGTIPGYAFRSFGGDRFVTLNAVASADIRQPWVRARLLGALGWSDVDAGDRFALRTWDARPTGAIKPALGFGAGFFHDIVRLDLARGLGAGGRWELILGTQPSFWDFL